MLVIISDLHLSDNSITTTIDPGAFQLFREQLTSMATRASWRSSELYRPIDSVDIVLLGDTLDLINSDCWLNSNTRPWLPTDSRELLDTVSNVVDRTLQANRFAAQMLRSLSKTSSLHIPIAAAPVSPEADSPTSIPSQSIPVRTHYMVGEHDWPLHLPGAGYDLLRQKVKQYLGLEQSFDVPFPHTSEQSPLLQRMLDLHEVSASHGDIADPFSYHGDRARSCISNVLSIELLQRFVLETIESAGESLPPTLRQDLLSLFDCEDVFQVPRQLKPIVERSISSAALASKYYRNWNVLVDRALHVCVSNIASLQFPETLIETARHSLHIDSTREPQATPRHLEDFMSRSETVRNRAIERLADSSTGEAISVWGHTHQCESFGIRSTASNEVPREQTYFNTGTWRPAFATNGAEITGAENNDARTGGCSLRNEIAFHAFYKQDERCGRRFEVWRGSLGLPAVSDGSVSDATVQSIRAVRSLAKASALSRPHFLDLGIAQTKRATID